MGRDYEAMVKNSKRKPARLGTDALGFSSTEGPLAIERAPEKREAILYARVSNENKAFITKLSDTRGLSESLVVNKILDIFRKNKSAGKSKKSSGGN